MHIEPNFSKKNHVTGNRENLLLMKVEKVPYIIFFFLNTPYIINYLQFYKWYTDKTKADTSCTTEVKKTSVT